MIAVLPAVYSQSGSSPNRNLFWNWILSIKVADTDNGFRTVTPHVRANSEFRYLIPICRTSSWWVVCATCHCAAPQRYVALTHFHLPCETGSDTFSQTVLIGGSLVTGAACSSGFSKALLRAALDFEMSCLNSHRSALTSNVYPDCKKTRGSRFPLHISANARVSSLLSASCILKVSP